MAFKAQIKSFFLAALLQTELSSAYCHAASPPVSLPAQVVVPEGAWHPFVFQSQGKSKGIATEIVSSCLSELGIKSSFVPTSISRMKSFLLSGDFDFFYMMKTADRESIYHYSKEPIFVSSYAIAVRADNPKQPYALSDLDPLHLTVFKELYISDKFLAYITKRKKNGQQLDETSKELPQLFKRLLESRTDVIVGARPALEWEINQLKLGDKVQVRNMEFTVDTPYYIVVSHKSKNITHPDSFLQEIDRCIVRMKDSGAYCKLFDQYGNRCPLTSGNKK